MFNSDSESEGGERSRSPVSPRRTESGSSSEDDLSPNSKKIVKIVKSVVARELAPIKRNLNKNLDTTTQMKGVVDQVKRGLADVKMTTSNIESDLKKARKSDPKSGLSSYVINQLNKSVFLHMKSGKKKEQLVDSVFTELVDKSVIGPHDEDSIKQVASREFSHLKSHLRSLMSQDLATGNGATFPKASQYMKKHVKLDPLPDDAQEFLTILGLGLVRYENGKNVQLSERDRSNKKKIEQHVDHFWEWVNLKFDNYSARGETHGEKMRHILSNVGYQARKSEGAVRRSSHQ